MRPMPVGAPAARTSAPRYATGAPDMPKHLGKRRGRLEAHNGSDDRSRTLAVVDRDILAAFCVAVADLETLSAEIDRDGLMIDAPTVDRNGRPSGATVRKPHPALKWRSDLMNKVRQTGGRTRHHSRGAFAGRAVAEAPNEKTNKLLEIRRRFQEAT